MTVQKLNAQDLRSFRSESPETRAAPESHPGTRAAVARVMSRRLVQFVVLGGLIFAGSRAYSKSQSHVIELSPAELGARREAELRKKPRVDVDAAVTERAVEDEILYRKGLELGFDRDDAIIRARVIQKTLFLAEELAGASEPASEAELRHFYETTKERWKQPERWKVVQIYARDRSLLDSQRDIANAHPAEIAALGEASPLPRETTVDRDFVGALPTEPTSEFVGPFESKLGWHLVRVISHETERQASFEEMRADLRGRVAIQKRQDAVATYLEKSFPEYDVRVGEKRITEIHPQGRMAVRKSGSAED